MEAFRGRIFTIWQQYRDKSRWDGAWGLWVCTRHRNFPEVDAQKRLDEIYADEAVRRREFPGTEAAYELREVCD